MVTKNEIFLNPKIKLLIKQDSIWNHHEKLDLLLLSITEQGQRGYFKPNSKKIIESKKIIDLNETSLDTVFSFCIQNEINKIGLLPWAKGDYNSFIKRIKEFNDDYPKEIILFHLNDDDYKVIKEYRDS